MVGIAPVGTALFFLLALRSNEAYQRWWEGRKLWGVTIARSRDMARQARTWITDSSTAVHMVKWIFAFAVSRPRLARLVFPVLGTSNGSIRGPPSPLGVICQ